MSIIFQDTLRDGGQNVGRNALDQSVNMFQILEPGEKHILK